MPNSVRHPRPWLRAFWNRAYRGEHHRPLGDGRLQPDAGGLPLRAAGPLRLRPGAEDQGGRDQRRSTTSQRLFPNVEQDTLTDVLNRIEDNSTTIGIAAFVGSLWIGASFWGAMDTAFCRIYHVECRGWVEQKRFSFAMLGVVLLFIAASIFVPAVESGAGRQHRQAALRPFRHQGDRHAAAARRGAARSPSGSAR